MKRSGIFEFLLFVLAGAVLFFSLGMAFAVMKMPPYRLFESTRVTLQQLITGPWFLDPHLVPRLYKGEGLVASDPSRVSPGVTVVEGVFANGPAVRVYAIDGRLLKEWDMDFGAVWPTPTHIVPERNIPRNKQEFHLQGLAMEPDGSIVVNFAEKGTAKFGACGGVDWTVDRMTHHSITRNPDGTYWIPTKRDPRQIEKKYLLPGVKIENIMDSDNFYADSALLVGADGTVLREVPVLEPVLDWLAENNQAQVLFDIDAKDLDPLHFNDIEVVTQPLADRIDGVVAGDLLLSLRNLHALAIVDATTGKVKWMQRGPWIRQHDPDITPEGLIEVFDNGINMNLLGRDFPGTRVLEYDPATGTVATLYPHTKEQSFFSWIMGGQQALPNGNLLITATTRGRVFEVTPEGETVWDLVLTSSKDTAALVETGTRLPPAYVSEDSWACK